MFHQKNYISENWRQDQTFPYRVLLRQSKSKCNESQKNRHTDILFDDGFYGCGKRRRLGKPNTFVVRITAYIDQQIANLNNFLLCRYLCNFQAGKQREIESDIENILIKAMEIRLYKKKIIVYSFEVCQIFSICRNQKTTIIKKPCLYLIATRRGYTSLVFWGIILI